MKGILDEKSLVIGFLKQIELQLLVSSPTVTKLYLFI